jgi:lipopolysaccharide/colanic/teichoic acid biosynthesis glycosyltransferase
MSKRTLDFLAAAGGILALSPLLLAIAVLVWLVHGRPVLFRQRRPGLHGVPFDLHFMKSGVKLSGKLQEQVVEGANS